LPITYGNIRGFVDGFISGSPPSKWIYPDSSNIYEKRLSHSITVTLTNFKDLVMNTGTDFMLLVYDSSNKEDKQQVAV